MNNIIPNTRATIALVFYVVLFIPILVIGSLYLAVITLWADVLKPAKD